MVPIDISLASRARPVSSSRDQILPLLPALTPLLPGGGLQRGTVITVGAGEGKPDGRGGWAGTGGPGGGAGTLALDVYKRQIPTTATPAGS